MTLAELAEYVSQYAKVPSHIRKGQSGRWERLLGITTRPGSGFYVEYTLSQARLYAAFLIMGSTLGDGTDNSALRRLAAEELADHETGYVVVSEGMVGWSPVVSLSTFAPGAAVIPVPKWM